MTDYAKITFVNLASYSRNSRSHLRKIQILKILSASILVCLGVRESHHHIPESGGETVPDEEEPPLKPQPSPELTPELLLLICDNKYISDESNQLRRS